MSFLYPYTVSISRMAGSFSATEGYTPGLQVIFSGLPASISVKRDKGFGKPPGFMANSETPTPMPMYDIAIPGMATLPMGSILNGDMVTDQNGMQYRVDAALWLPMGYNLYCGPYIATA